ncbi:MAG TPA: aspartate kinase [Bacteroidales bacterium]|nr:aspartate kinase [Bacteroidales bacterium]
MLTVEKIGGTSMSKFDEVLKNIIIGQRKAGDYYNRIFVVSAYNNVTNWLLEHKKTGEPGIYSKFEQNRDYTTALDELLRKLIALNRKFAQAGLSQFEADEFITTRISEAGNYLKSLADVLGTGYVNRQNILLAAREILSSIGEAHSAFNSVNMMLNHGIHTRFIDLCGFNDAEYLTIDERIRNAFRGIDFSTTLPVATGYTKGTEGIMREFDRGYSEVTFSKIAVEVKAEEAVIHKEFHLSSADPNIVGIEKSVPVGFTNFNVADQLADVGMEAIHPKASKPLELAGINIRLKNTFEPEHPGTLISKDYIDKDPRVEIITGSDKVVAIEVHDPLMVGSVGFDRGIMDIFEKHNVSYILKATNANSITQVIWEHDLRDAFVDELKSLYHKVSVVPCSLVCALGTNVTRPGVIAKATTALAERCINISALSQSLSQVNIQFVLPRESYRDAVIALNDALCYRKGRRQG